MPSLRDHLSDLPVRARLLANRTHVRASDWLDPRLRRLHVDNPRARVRHLLAGGRPARALATTPVARNRINPATGRPRWTDRSDGALARWRADRERAQGRDARDGAGPPRTPGVYELREHRWVPARDFRAPDLRARLPRGR